MPNTASGAAELPPKLEFIPTALGINSNFGGSSAAPDAVFGMTLWKKF